nr:MAG TPA: Mitochondrial division protein 1 [Caudoviricetes sp.]
MISGKERFQYVSLACIECRLERLLFLFNLSVFSLLSLCQKPSLFQGFTQRDTTIRFQDVSVFHYLTVIEFSVFCQKCKCVHRLTYF